MTQIQLGFCMPIGASNKSERATFVEDLDRAMELVTGHFDSAWFVDHVQFGDADVLEGFTALTYMAARHPQLKIVMAEAGLAWVPSMIQGLDIWYQRTRDGRRLTGDSPVSLPELLPSEYFHRQIWISFVDDPLGIKMVGSVLDADKVMFGSDYPHPASTWPHSQEIIEEQIKAMSPEIAKKIFRDNARLLFAIE